MTDTDPELLRERSHKAIRVILEAVVALALAGMGSIAALYPRHLLYSGPVWLPDPVLPMTSERQRMQELLDRIADPIPGKKPLPSTAILEDAVKTIRSSGGFCGSATRTYLRSATKNSSFIDVKCQNGETYVIRTTSRGSISVLTCDELKAFTSLESYRFAERP